MPHLPRRITSFRFEGVQAHPVTVEARLRPGRRGLIVDGLADAAEVAGLVRSALGALGLSLPPGGLKVRFTPCIPGKAEGMPLAVAVAALAAMDVLPADELDGYAVLGNLSSAGEVLPCPGVLPAALAAGHSGRGFICSTMQASEAAWARNEVIAPPGLLELVNHFRGTQVLHPPEPVQPAVGDGEAAWARTGGMHVVRRGIEVAAAGLHPLVVVTDDAGLGGDVLDALLALLPDIKAADALKRAIHSSLPPLPCGNLMSFRPSLLDLTPDLLRDDFEVTGTGLSSMRIAGGALVILPEDMATEMLSLDGDVAPSRAWGVRRWRAMTSSAGVLGATVLPPGHALLGTEVLSAAFTMTVEACRPAEVPTPDAALAVVRARVARTRSRLLSSTDDHAVVDAEATAFLAGAVGRGLVAHEQVDDVVRVARTLASLGSSGAVSRQDVAEAMHFRIRHVGNQLSRDSVYHLKR